jgi:predicted NBD/HSP70 family sugar kinase
MVINLKASLTPASLRRTHRGMVLSQIETEPGIARSELARRFGFSEMAATRIVRELLEARIIEEFDLPENESPKNRAVGRPKIGLRVVPKSLFAVGITVSAYHSEVSICDAVGTLHASKRIGSPSFDDVTETARFYAIALRELIAESKVDVERIVGVGVALSARTDPDNREITMSEYFGWENDGGSFCRAIQEILDLPIQIENIANALAIAEMRFGAARDLSEFALVHAATFVGASVVSENHVVRGNSGVSGRIGHFRADNQPLACVCGRNDCLNLSATGFGLLSKLGKLDHPAFDTSKLSYYADSLMAVLEDKSSADMIWAAGGNLAPALDSIAKLLGPQMIIVSGHLGSNQTYFEGVKAALERDFDFKPESPFTLELGSISSVMSASLLALCTFCYSDQLDYERFASVAENREDTLHG